MVVGFSWIGAGYNFNTSRPLRYNWIVFIVINSVKKTALHAPFVII